MKMGAGRRFLAIASLAILAAGPVAADAPRPFEAAAFETAQAAGRPVLVVISAPWCPICRSQKPIIAALGDAPRFRELAIFEIDFDTQKPFVRALRATAQSTLILFRGRTEVGRSIGETQPEWIEDFAEKAL